MGPYNGGGTVGEGDQTQMTKGDGLQVTDVEAGGGVNGRSFLGGQLDAPRAGSGPSEEERGLTRFRTW